MKLLDFCDMIVHMIKFVIFDVMGVIFTVGDDVEGVLIPYIRPLKPEIETGKIKENYIDASLGKISSYEFWARAGFDEAAIPAVERNYLEKSFSLDEEFIPCARELKGRYGIALLSNDVSEWSVFLRKFYGIEPLINAAFISGDLGVRKPDPEIYRIALKSLGAKPSECVFIDDSPERVDAARELGISSVLFDREGHDYKGLRVKSFEQIKQLLL